MAVKNEPSKLTLGLGVGEYIALLSKAKASGGKSNNSGPRWPTVSPFNAEYLQRLKSNDPATAAHFYQYFRPRLLMMLVGHRLQEADKPDIIHDTFVQVLKGVQADAVREPQKFGAYVSKVCCHVRSRYLIREHVNIDEIDLPDPAVNVGTLLLCKERKAQVEMVLWDLRPRDRNLLRAKIFDHLSSEEVMVKFGASSPGHLRLLLCRARKRFAKAWRKRGWGVFLG